LRLFIAINFEDKVKQRIAAVQEQLRKETSRGNFTRRENLHLTLVFLGETAEERLPEIKEIMECAVSTETKPFRAFELVFSRAGFFKRGGKELWHLGIDEEDRAGEKQLAELQSLLAKELIARNFFIDNRPFTAHITLGREIHNGPWPFKTESIVIPVKRISLMQSYNKQVSGEKNKLVYTELFGCDLGG